MYSSMNKGHNISAKLHLKSLRDPTFPSPKALTAFLGKKMGVHYEWYRLILPRISLDSSLLLCDDLL